MRLLRIFLRRLAITAQHLHLIGDDVVSRALHAVLVGVLTGFDFALDVHLTALFQVLPGNLCQFAVHGHVMPFCGLLALAVFVGVLFTCSYGKVTDSFAFAMKRVSGSRPRRPIRITLFNMVYLSQIPVSIFRHTQSTPLLFA